MRFFNILHYDMHYGLLGKPGKWIVVTTYSVFLFISFCFSVFHGFYGEINSLWNINSFSLSAGDLLLVSLGGKLPLYHQQAHTYNFPMPWFIWHILICYFTLTYMSEDLSQGGVQVITRAKQKMWWWTSKCLWNMTVVIIYYAVGYLALWVLALLSGENRSWVLNPQIFQLFFAQNLPDTYRPNLFTAVCVLPCLVGVTVNLMQMTLTLFIKPIFAFIIMCCYYIIGIYYAHPLVLTNYAIPVRSADIGIYNFQPLAGAMLCLLLCLLSVLVGAWKIRRKDILGTNF